MKEIKAELNKKVDPKDYGIPEGENVQAEILTDGSLQITRGCSTDISYRPSKKEEPSNEQTRQE